MFILLLFLSTLHSVRPHGAPHSSDCLEESSKTRFQLILELKELLKKSEKDGQDIGKILRGYIEEVESSITVESLKLEESARGTTLGAFERVCKSNAALFCDSAEAPNSRTHRESTTDSTIAELAVVAFLATVGSKPSCFKFTSTGEYLRVKDDFTVDVSKQCESDGLWTIEEREGTVVLKGYSGQFLSTYSNGSVGQVSELEEAEMWEPVYNGAGSWSLRNRNGHYLSSHRLDKIVCTMPHNEDREYFVVDVEASEAAVQTTTLSTSTSTTTAPATITSTKETPLTSTTPSWKPWPPTEGTAQCLGFGKWNYVYLRMKDRFTVEISPACDIMGLWTIEERDGVAVVKSHTGLYLSAQSDGTVSLAREAGKTEMWTAGKGDRADTWSLKSCYGKYLSYTRKDKIASTMPHLKHDESFVIHPWEAQKAMLEAGLIN